MKLISSTKDLKDAVRQLSKSDFVTVDTEFIRETTYWPELCLIQMATPGYNALVDPLADGIELSPFFELMADEKITKVFHAARQDIEIVFHRGGLIPNPVFDTQVAAMVCGFGDSISYEQLVQRIAGAQIDKSSRFTDWRRRPLSDKQLTYALADVTHLVEIYQNLRDQLRREDREHWVKEEMDILTDWNTYDIQPEDSWRRLKLRARKPIELAVLQAIAAWRETTARERNVPRRRVLKDDAIYEIAQQQPQDAGSLARLRTIPKGWERSSAATALTQVVARTMTIPKEDLPRLPKPQRMPEGAGAAADLLKVLLKLVADRQGVAAKVLANSDDIEKIAAKGSEADVGALKGWRREVFGEKALKLVEGDLALKFENRKISVFETGPAGQAGNGPSN